MAHIDWGNGQEQDWNIDQLCDSQGCDMIKALWVGRRPAPHYLIPIDTDMPYEPFIMITYILKMCWGTGCSKSELSFASIWDGCNGSTRVLFKGLGVCLYRIRDNLYKLPKITEEIFCFRYYFRWYWIHIEDNISRIGKFHFAKLLYESCIFAWNLVSM